MSNINLNFSEESASRKEAKAFGSSVIISIICLLLVLLLYGFLLVANKNLNTKIGEANDQYQEKYDAFVAGNARSVIDFNNRSKEAKRLLDGDEKTTEILGEIERTILPSVYLTSLKYDRDKKTVSLSCVGDNFNTVAKQVLSFKESQLFSSVVPGASVVDSEKNQLNFEIDIKIK